MKKLAWLALAALGIFAGPVDRVSAHEPVIIDQAIPVRMVRVWVPAVYSTVIETIYVPGGYQSVQDQVWVEPVYGWVSDPDCGWTVITPEHWEIGYRQIWVPGHEETVSRQELVTPGHWEWVQVPGPIPMPEPLPAPQIYQGDPPKVGVDGYGSGDAAKPETVFSPLDEWPK